MRHVLAAFLTLAVGGCLSAPPTVPVGPTTVESSGVKSGALTLSIQPPAYTVQTLVRRWLASDIYEYAVTLQYWSGTAYVDFDPPLTVVLPQKVESPKHEAVFSNLKQGSKYRARLVVRGNEGGTAPTYVLNAESQDSSVFDFTPGQDVQDNQAATLQGQLDAVPFSGSAAVAPQNVPVGATALEAVLKNATSGATISTLTYAVGEQANFSNLKAGPGYTVELTALENGTPLATASSASFGWDPTAVTLESDQTVTVSFPTSP